MSKVSDIQNQIRKKKLENDADISSYVVRASVLNPLVPNKLYLCFIFIYVFCQK